MFELFIKWFLCMIPLLSDSTVRQEVGYSSKDTVYSAKEDIGYSSKSSKDVIENIPESINPLDGRYYPPIFPPIPPINPPHITNVNPR